MKLGLRALKFSANVTLVEQMEAERKADPEDMMIKHITKIQALIADLQKQLAALGGGNTTTFPCASITKNLFYGMANDPQIKCLQEVLKNQGYAVIVSGNYDAVTKAAVALFQQKYASEILTPYHLTRGSGNVGNATRAKINLLIVVK